MATPKAGDGASSQKRGKAQEKEQEARDLYLTLFLDDFQEPPAQKEEKPAVKKKKVKKGQKQAQPNPQPNPSSYSNLWKLYLLYQLPSDNEQKKKKELHDKYYIQGYDTGARRGSHNTMEQAIAMPLSWSSVWLGCDAMSSVTGQINRAVTHINTLLMELHIFQKVPKVNLHVNLFGYGRGAFAARAVAMLINPDDQFTLDDKQMKMLGWSHPKGAFPMEEPGTKFIQSKKIHVMGLFDTIASVGAPRTEPYNTFMNHYRAYLSKYRDCRHDTNAHEFGQYATKGAEHVLHICAMDEHRLFFPLIDIENSLDNGTELFLPGCHEDIGGGCLDPIGFINRISENLVEVVAYKLSSIKKLVSDTSNKYSSKKIVDMPACVKAYNAFQSYHHTITCTQFEEANKKMGECIQYFESGIDVEIVLEVQEFKRWLQDEVQSYKKEEHTMGNKKESIDVAKSLTNNWKDIDDNLRYMISSCEVIQKDSEFITEKASHIPPVDENWVKAKQEGREKSIHLALRTKSLAQRYEQLRKSIEDICEIIDENKDWLFAENNKQTALSRKLPHEKPESLDDLYPVCGRAIRALGWVQDRLFTWDDFLNTGKPDPMANDYSESLSWGEDGVPSTQMAKILRGDETEEVFGTGVIKHTCGGYQLIPLKLMWDWCKSIDSKMMAAWPQNHTMPKDLQQFYDGIKSAVNRKGRIFAYPYDEYEEGYRVLRCKYLQFSPSDHGRKDRINTGACTCDRDLFPNAQVVTRRVYPGQQGARSPFEVKEKFKFIYDYDPDITTASVNFNAEFDDHWIVADRDGSMSDKLQEYDLHASLKNPDNIYSKKDLEQMEKKYGSQTD
ncbi:MAG: DUF2235 domain-containing protein [Bacteroidales bacterium]|nr:DUF2235 domain-containing protein [Candidatus Physcousia equi]